MSVAQGLLPYKVEVTGRPERVTAYAGLPVVVEALRAVASKALYRELRDALGYGSWKTVRRHVESLVLLLASGGECLDDVRMLRGDPGLAVLLGGEPSSATQLKVFLYRFHQHPAGRPWTVAEDAALAQKGTAEIRAEGPGLRALGQVVRAVVARVQGRQPRERATLDVDATLIEAHKQQALRAYEGTVGYQPQMAWWAEQGVWVGDEFRDGNVPAAFGVKAFLQRVFGSLPAGVTERRLRGDSALYEEDALTWAADVGEVQFAVSADMTEALAAHIAALPEGAWRPYRSLAADGAAAAAEEREWAEVPDFLPGWARNYKNGTVPLRYVAIRVRARQQTLLTADGAPPWRHFAVVTNMAWDGERLLRWHREKQGTVEHAHGVVKNELGGGTVPCGRFGANAAYWRLAVLTHNLLTLLQGVALPREWTMCRPKALRFRLLHLAGWVVRHAGRIVVRVSAAHPWAGLLVEVRRALVVLAGAPPPLPA